MSTYPDRKSPFWQFSFDIDGRRYSGSTKVRHNGTWEQDAEGKWALKNGKNKREADKVELRKRDEVEAAGTGRLELTVDVAFGRYYDEHARFLSNHVDKRRDFERLSAALGPHRKLSDLSTGLIHKHIASRRAETTKHYDIEKPLANGTINTHDVSPVHAMLTFARDTWGAKTPDIDWKRLWLPEEDTHERDRELSEREIERIFGKLRDDLHPVVLFLLLTGTRRSEATNLQWQQVDLDGLEIRIFGKGRRWRTIPITEEVAELVAAQRGKHSQYVFTMVVQKAGQWGYKVGDRIPIRAKTLSNEWIKCMKAAGIQDARLHDTRHTFATQTLRACRNIKAVSRLLGHTKIAMTSRYAHVDMDDQRDALAHRSAMYHRKITGSPEPSTLNPLASKAK